MSASWPKLTDVAKKRTRTLLLLSFLYPSFHWLIFRIYLSAQQLMSDFSNTSLLWNLFFLFVVHLAESEIWNFFKDHWPDLNCQNWLTENMDVIFFILLCEFLALKGHAFWNLRNLMCLESSLTVDLLNLPWSFHHSTIGKLINLKYFTEMEVQLSRIIVYR